MVSDKILKHLIFFLIIASMTFYYGAYAAGIIAFFVLLAKEPNRLLAPVANSRVFKLIFAALSLSTIFSKVLGYSLLMYGLILVHIMVFLVLIYWIKAENIDNISSLLNSLGIVLCVIGIYQYFTGDLNINISWTDKVTFGNLIRIYSTFRNPNIFAAFLTFNISYAVAYFVKKRASVYAALNIMLSTLCLILTYSRGGFLAFAAAMLLIALLCKDIRVGIYLAAVIALYYAYNIIGSTNRENLSTLVFDSSSLYRVEIWKASWQLFTSNIILGSGPGSVTKLLSFSSDVLKGYIAHAHNIYLQLLAEAGIVGLTAFGSLVLQGIRAFAAFWISYKHSKHSYIALGYIAALAAMLVHGLVDCAVLIPSRSLVFLIYLSLFPALCLNSCKGEQISSEA